MAAARAAADEVRQLRRRHRARARAARRDRLDGGEAIMDARMFIHYFRTTADGRVVMGSGGGPIGAAAGSLTAGSPTRRRRRAPRPGCGGCFPRSPERGRARRGAGRSTSRPTNSRSSGPSLGTRVHYAAGYSGSGVGPSWLGAQALASLALGARRRVEQARRSCAAPRRRFRRSRSSGLGGGARPRRRSRSRTRRSAAPAVRRSPARSPPCRACWGCRSAGDRADRHEDGPNGLWTLGADRRTLSACGS